MIFDNTKVEDFHNEDVDVMEEEGNDDDKDFVPIARESVNLERIIGTLPTKMMIQFMI
jgi:hypothetical protein